MPARPPRKPLMVYDGRCGFCRRWILRWKAITGVTVRYASYQRVASRFPEIPRERFQQAVHLIEPDGRTTSGAAAVFRTLAVAGRYGWLWRLYGRLPGFALAAEWVYRFVSRHRPEFDRLERAFFLAGR